MFSYNYSLPKDLKDYIKKSVDESVKRIKEKELYGSYIETKQNIINDSDNYKHNNYVFPLISFISFIIGYKLGRDSR